MRTTKRFLTLWFGNQATYWDSEDEAINHSKQLAEQGTPADVFLHIVSVRPAAEVTFVKEEG